MRMRESLSVCLFVSGFKLSMPIQHTSTSSMMNIACIGHWHNKIHQNNDTLQVPEATKRLAVHDVSGSANFCISCRTLERILGECKLFQ